MHAMCFYTSQICIVFALFNPPQTHNQTLHIWAWKISDQQGQAFEKASGCSVIQEVHHIKAQWLC